MIKPAHRFSDGGDRRHIQSRRPSQQNDWYAERACRSNFAIGRRTAAVLRHDDVNGVRAQKLSFLFFGKGSSIENIVSARDGERRVHGIDAANQIVILRGHSKIRDFLATDGKEHPSGSRSQRIHRLPHVADFRPLIAGHCKPWRSAQAQQRCGGLPGGVQRMGRHRGCIRMGGVDQGADLMAAQVFNEPGNSAEAAGSRGHSLRQWSGGAAGQRQNGCHVGTDCEPFTQQPRLRGAPKNEDVLFHAAR